VKRQTLIGCSALAVGAITVIINPRVNISEETFVLISCTTRQIVMVNRTEPDSQSYTVANGIYSVEELVDSIYGQAEQKMEIELSGNMFAGLARGLITSLRPVIETYANNAVDDVCAFKQVTISPKRWSFD
tara:strand:+ start:250 stop:642 length:393 start_codon:yes stop_codon:yes gene_type:complete